MLRKFFLKLSDSCGDESLANKYRRKRFQFFSELISGIENQELKILDIGGTQNFWKQMNFLSQSRVSITIVNLFEETSSHENISCVVGDATNLGQFEDNHFDIVFSNSVIEHVGEFENQEKMSNEVKRLSSRYFVQTPNYYFPLEPHFLFVGFQWLPLKIRAWLIRNFKLGWFDKTPDYEESVKIAKDIRLLKREELVMLFPEASIYEEKFAGLVKSFVAYDGF